MCVLVTGHSHFSIFSVAKRPFSLVLRSVYSFSERDCRICIKITTHHHHEQTSMEVNDVGSLVRTMDCICDSCIMYFYQYPVYLYAVFLHPKSQMNIPDESIMNIFSNLPKYSYLPIAHVCKRFRLVYLNFKRLRYLHPEMLNDYDDTEEEYYFTNPLSIGHLFDKPWRFHQALNSKLNLNLLSYFVKNGYGKNENGMENEEDSLKKVMLQTVSRGDIEGMHFMSVNKIYPLNEEDITTMAAAAGQLDALQWLRGKAILCNGKELVLETKCPWNPTDVHREAAENCHDDILDYVEKNCEGHQIQISYGVGLPW